MKIITKGRSDLLTFCMLVIFHAFVVWVIFHALTFFKIYFLKNLFHEYYQSVKQFGFR